MIVTSHVAGIDDEFVRRQILALSELDERWYRRHPQAPTLAAAGVRYRADPVAYDIHLYDAQELYLRGAGSCGSLAAAHAAWLRANKRPAMLKFERTGQGVWHVSVVSGERHWDPRKELRHG